MRITWARGFLRLWIVASLAWAAFVGVLVRPDTAWIGVAQPSGQPAYAYAYAYAKPDSGMQNVGPQFLVFDNEAFIAAVQRASHIAANKTLVWFAWMAGMPILFALLVGLAVRWVVRGLVGPSHRREPAAPGSAPGSAVVT